MRRFNLVLLILFTIALSPGPSRAKDEFIRVLPASPAPDQDQAVSWSLETEDSGLKSIVTVSFELPEKSSDIPGEPVWEYHIEIDNGMVLKRGIHPASEKRVEENIPLAETEDGSHTLRLLVRDFNGKAYNLERKFTLDARPEIRIISQKNQKDIFDPQLELSFFGTHEGFAGSAEIRLDNTHLGDANVEAKRNKVPVPLSTLTGKEIFMSDLGPGSHLLSIEARGMNGSTAVLYHRVHVGIFPPEIKIHNDVRKAFQKIVIRFPASANAYTGRAEIQYNHSVIFSANAKGKELEITREDLLKALETHHLSLKAFPRPFILAVETAGHIQDWQSFQFR